ncbi:MAG: efflux RND transporter periplasmic adaptor subunit [Bacteroidetes bacterium]|nr:efflux RND transporter periplasmic adaptor subunit [Bacteroidota bacterium]
MNNTLRYAGFIAMIVAIASCGDKQAAQQQAPPAVPVSTYIVQPGSATYYDVYPATVTPLNQVDIKPQVSGNIINIFFKDGQHVKKGQKLYEIDQQQYKGAYEQAVANLNVAKANLAKSQQDADRYEELAKQDAIAKQTLDHQLADLESAKRQVDAAQANVSTVQTNLKYSIIYAPFDGTIGISQVKVGTSVYQQTLLNTVSSDDPIAVDIAISQDEIPHFITYLDKGTNLKDSIFTVVLPDGSVYPYPGNLSLLDRAVDPQTGTIKARLVFPNAKNYLKAGITTNVRVKHNAGESSLLIPYKSVVEQLGEYFVFVVKDNRATQHKVSLGTRINDKIIVRSGVEQGDSIVTEGVQKLRDSSIVRVGAPKAAPPAK